MSIFRSTFSDTVKGQLKVRQEAMVNRTPQNLSYINSRNAWIRLTSSVNVNGSPDLAKTYVLQGGTLNPNNTQKAGLGSSFDNYAYSNKAADGTPYRLGIRPMPGINSVDIKSKSAYGSLREAVVKFQCWDIKQLEDLEVLYMRPGYTVLLEWGWTPYLNNNGDYKSNFIDYYDILNKQPTERTILFKELYEQSVKYNGNYDAMFGYIRNYRWSARDDGGYDCETTIVTTGEIIESLKVNYTIPDKVGGPKSEKYPSGVLAGEFAGDLTLPSKAYDGYEQNILTGIWKELYYQTLNPNSTIPSSSIFKSKEDLVFKEVHFTDDSDREILGNTSGLTTVYASLKSVIEVLNKYVIAKSSYDGKSLMEISLKQSTITDPSGSILLCTAHPLQVSIDPSVCLIKSPLWSDGTVFNTAVTSIAEDEDPSTEVAKAAYEKIIEGFEGSDTKSDILEGLSMLTTPSIYNAVNTLIESEGKYENLMKLLEGETYGIDDVYLANDIVDTLNKALPSLNVKSENSSLFNPGLLLDPNSVGFFAEYTFTATPPPNNGVAVSQVTIEQKSQNALGSLEIIKNLPLDYFYNNTYSELGVIGNIYINLDFLYKQALTVGGLESNDNKGKNEINLYNYLKSLIQAIQTALGNVSNFEIHVDPIDNNIARIIDINYTDPERKIYDKLFELPIHTLNSVVRSYSLESKIFPDQSTIVAIGSQAKSALGVQANTLIDFNRNLTDRILLEKVDGLNSNIKVNNNVPTIINGLAKIVSLFAELKDFSTNDESNSNGTLKTNNVTNLANEAKNALRDIIVYFQSITKSTGSNRNLIPTRFSCEMDGIGGLVIGHMFKLPKNIMPKGYRGIEVGSQLGNTITSIGHTIEGGDWITRIDTLNIVLEDPKGVEFSSLDLNKLKEILTQALQEAVTGGGGGGLLAGNKQLSLIIESAGYPKDTALHTLALTIGTQEGWSSTANGGAGSLSYRNNNPGNLDFDSRAKSIDPGAGANGRFTRFTTAELGAKALIENKIKRWAQGNMPITSGNQSLINPSEKWNNGSKPTIAQFFYTYAPPNENNTEAYINNIISTLKQQYPSINRNTLVYDLINSQPITTSTEGINIGLGIGGF